MKNCEVKTFETALFLANRSYPFFDKENENNGSNI